MSEDDQSSLRLEIQPRARQDMAATLAFTERRWGREQRAAYRTLLLGVIHDLRRYPTMGRERDDIFAGCRSIVAGSHLILYQVLDKRLIVVPILHGRQNPRDQLDV